MARRIPEFPFRPWPLFHHRSTLVGDWVAIWRLPRPIWGSLVVCDHCNADLSRYRWIMVAAYPIRDEWIRWGIAASNPLAGHAYCRACARRFLPPCEPVPGMPPLLFTSHDISGWPLVPVTGFTSTSTHAFGRPLRAGWDRRLSSRRPCRY